MTGRAGGWPLTVFLTPDQLPIFTGTYFPKERRYGMPAFREVLVAIEEYYRAQARRDPRSAARSLVDALGNTETSNADEFATLSRTPLLRARERLEQSFDSEHGGFGDGPKFPHPTTLELLLALEARARGRRGGRPRSRWSRTR